MASVIEAHTRKRDRDGFREAEVVLDVSDNETVAASTLELSAIHQIKSVVPNADTFIAGGASVTNRGSLANDVTLRLYDEGGGTLNAAASIPVYVHAVGQ